ncbi:MAG: hypothetical protein QOH10_2074 [Actinomycetota bacterium]|jgi:plastocyanin|nr:hypothetical protein [Actinomycetota bacterium]
MAKRYFSRVAMWCVAAVAGASLVVGGAGVSGAAVSPAATANVTIQDFAFKPKAITIVVGTKVTWTNNDSVGHNVVFRTFGSPVLATGQTWSHTFKKIKTFRYHCSLHSAMTGRVIVTG